MNQQYLWLYDNILPKKQSFHYNIFKSKSYNERLLEEMLSSEETFWKVYNKGIDLVLHK